MEIRRRVRQYEQHRLVCGHGGAVTLGALPAEAVHSRYGPSLTALAAVLSGVSQLARREVARLCGELFGVPVSVGSVQKLCEQMSAAVAAPVDALADAIRQQPVVGMDETSWRVQHKLRYPWVAWSPLGSIYKIATRAAKVGQSLLGAAFAGCAMTDRYKGHDWIPWRRRRLCWAHDADVRIMPSAPFQPLIAKAIALRVAASSARALAGSPSPRARTCWLARREGKADRLAAP